MEIFGWGRTAPVFLMIPMHAPESSASQVFRMPPWHHAKEVIFLATTRFRWLGRERNYPSCSGPQSSATRAAALGGGATSGPTCRAPPPGPECAACPSRPRPRLGGSGAQGSRHSPFHTEDP